MRAPLHIVTPEDAPARPQTVAQRVRELQAEAKKLAADHVRGLCILISDAADSASEIANGGAAYPAGVRDLARRFAEDAETRVQTIEAIIARISS